MQNQTKNEVNSTQKNEMVSGQSKVLGGGSKGDVISIDGDAKILTDDVTGERFIFFTKGTWAVGDCVNYTPDHSNPVQGFPQAIDVTHCD